MPQQQQQLIPAPQPMIGQGAAMPMIGQGAAMQLPPQIGRPMCCPCFGNGRKRRSLYFLQHKHAKSK